MPDLNNFNKEIIKAMEAEYRHPLLFPECKKLLLFLHSLFVITGQLDVMFCNAFIAEVIHLLKNALFLHRDGLYDCAFYSVREAHETINSMLYLVKDRSMKKDWNEKKYFPMDKKLRDKLKKLSIDYNEIRDIIPEFFIKQEDLIKQIQQLEQKMAKSPNNMNNSGSHFLYHREQIIRFKLMQAGISQKKLSKHLNLTESYVSKLITGERYNQDFEIFLRKFLQFDYCFI